MTSTYPRIDLKNPYLAAVLAWLVPGLGHLYQGRIGKAIIFAFCIHGMFWTGFALGDWRVVWLRWDREEKSWPYLAQVGVGAAALPALFNSPQQREWLPEPLKSFQLPPSEELLDESHIRRGKLIDVALIYTIIAGLLNYFVIYDALAGPALRDEEAKRIADRTRSEEPAGDPAS